MKPEDIYRQPVVGQPRISPDASTVAFVVTQADEESNDYRSAIWTVPVDGSASPTRFSFSEKRDAMPRWSPDGKWLAFASSRDGKGMQLYVAPLVGGEARKLTDLDEGVSSISWSPDSRFVAIGSTVRGPDWSEEDEGKRPPRVITKLNHKADGRGHVFDRYTHVFVVDAASGDVTQLTDGDFDHSECGWSPDSSTLCVSANRDADERTHHTDLWLFDTSGGTSPPRKLTASDAMYMKAAWSPDGQRIAAHVYPDIETAPWNTQLAIIDVASGSVEIPTRSLDLQCGPYFHPREPIWLSDDRVLFAADDAGNTHQWTLDVTNGTCAPLGKGDVVVSDHDAVGDVIVKAEGTATRPNELFNGDIQLTRITDEFVGSVGVSAPERFVAVSKDGTEVEAWIMKPVGGAADARYPTLLFIHGGPFTQYGNVFFDEFQVAAEAGYVVVYSNPRGASGYGDDFGRAIRGPISGGPGWGTVDYEDLMAVVDRACEFDFVDGERLGVLGGSYGGFMTAWIVGHTDRFKAACAERGIYNALSAIGTSDGLWSSNSVWGGDPYEHPDQMMQISPLTYADAMTTPLLIVHSDQDHRCPIEQAEQMFTRLRLLGRDVKFVRFPQGTHDLSRGGPPRQRVFRHQLILDWFDAKL